MPEPVAAGIPGPAAGSPLPQPPPPRPEPAWAVRWFGPVAATGVRPLAAAAGAGLVTAVVVPLDRPGLGWVVAGAAVAGAIGGVRRPVCRSVVAGAAGATADLHTRRWEPLAWGLVTLALLAVGTVRAAEWLFGLCLLAAAVATVAQRALAAGFTEVEVVVSASDTHNRRNVNRSTEESLDDIAALVDELHRHGATAEVIISTSFGCPYEGDVDPVRVAGIVDRVVADGADRASFGDTTGMATPRRVRDVLTLVRQRHPELPLLLHFHDTRGTALANILTALQLGITEFDASVGGLGGCPYAPGATGNVATEEVVHMLHDMGIDTGIDLDTLIEVAALAQDIVGRELPSGVLRAGPRTRLVAG